MTRHQFPKGFTLIELIIVIVITGIIAAVVSPIFGNQFQAYTDSSRRATLVQEAQSVMQLLERDLYYAVPNSTRVSDGADKLELLILARSSNSERLPSARYQEDQFGDGNFKEGDAFNIFGCFTTGGNGSSVVIASRDPNQTLAQVKVGTSPGPTLADFNAPEPECDLPDNPYPKGVLTLEADHDFADTSSFNRLYFTDGEITYTCSENGLGRAREFDGGAAASVPVAALADACEFEYLIGGTYNPPSLLVSITLGDADDEKITLIRSFQLVNAP